MTLSIRETCVPIDVLHYRDHDFQAFREGDREDFVHAPNVRLNAQRSHRFAEAFVARWLRETRQAEVWAGTVALFERPTKRHVCTSDVVQRLVDAFGQERVGRLHVASPTLVTPDVLGLLPDGSWRFIEVKRARDWPPRVEQLRALAYLQWLGMGHASLVRILPEAQAGAGPTQVRVPPFEITRQG